MAKHGIILLAAVIVAAAIMWGPSLLQKEGTYFVVFGLCLVALGNSIEWLRRRKQLGAIHCKRCNYVGPAKGSGAPVIGFTPVCPQCHSQDWVKVQAR